MKNTYLIRMADVEKFHESEGLGITEWIRKSNVLLLSNL
ncbi:hypothetical protein J2Y03_002921 [Neobacillus niacini]|nr:hypothetical protein [Neobacillus niacini]